MHTNWWHRTLSIQNAMLADTEYSINSFQKAKIVIMAPDSYIDERRKKPQGLSAELPNSYMLGESVYAPLLSDEFWSTSILRLGVLRRPQNTLSYKQS